MLVYFSFVTLILMFLWVCWCAVIVWLDCLRLDLLFLKRVCLLRVVVIGSVYCWLVGTSCCLLAVVLLLPGYFTGLFALW